MINFSQSDHFFFYILSELRKNGEMVFADWLCQRPDTLYWDYNRDHHTLKTGGNFKIIANSTVSWVPHHAGSKTQSVAYLTRSMGCRFKSQLGHITLVQIDHEIISSRMIILLLPLIHEVQLSVTGISMCTSTQTHISLHSYHILKKMYRRCPGIATITGHNPKYSDTFSITYCLPLKFKYSKILQLRPLRNMTTPLLRPAFVSSK